MTKRWFTWDRRSEPELATFLQRMRERGWLYLGESQPVETVSGIDLQFVWDDERGEPPVAPYSR